MKFKNKIFSYLVLIVIFLIFVFLGISHYVYNTTLKAVINSKIITPTYNYIFQAYNYIDYKQNMSCINKINPNIKSRKIDYNFFVAGHVYGSPYDNNVGIYPKLYNFIKNKKKDYDFAIFAGDITRVSKIKSWILFKEQLNELNIKKYYVAPGNHDIGIDKNHERIAQFNKYFNNVNTSFYYKGDLFIIFDGFENNWSIKHQQLNFLKKLLYKNKFKVNSVFIIAHPPIFYKSSLNIKINSFAGIGKNLNFWETISPILQSYSQDFFIISGDLGAFKGNAIYCNKNKNLHFLGTGMGAGDYDNFIEFTKIKNYLNIEPILF